MSLLTNLYAYYKLDEASGSALDASGNARTLANFANPIGTSTGIIGTSRNFPGTQAYFTDSNATHFSPGTAHFSFSTWVNMTSTGYAGGSGDVGFLTKCGTADNREYILWIATGGDKKFRLFCSNDGTAIVTVVWPTVPNAGTWYHLCGGWDGTNIWLTQNAGTRVTAAFAGPMFVGNVGFQMGFEGGSSAFLNGKMDETAFWIGHDLSSAEITQLYSNGLGLPFSSFGSTVRPSDGSPGNIQAIHDSAACVDGDVITIPSGTFVWDVSAGGTAGVHITKAITLQGNTTTDEVAGTDGGQTVLADSDARRGSGGRPFIRVDTDSTNDPNKRYRITGLAFDKGAATTQNFNGTVTFGGQSRNVRIDHCSFRANLAGIELLYCQMSGAVCGVADHNVFIGSVSFHLDNGDSWFLPNGSIGASGDGSFAAPTAFGGPNFWFVEDNYFKGLNPALPGGGPDDLRGGRWVWRYNHMYDCPIQSHGTEDGRWHGGRAREVYNNDFHFTNASVGGWGGVRSGVTLFHDNTSAGRWPGDGMYGLSIYRTIHKWPATPFFGCTGDNPWDVNDVTDQTGNGFGGGPNGLYTSGTATATTNQSTMVDSTKNWPLNQWAGFTAKYTGPNGGDNVAFIKSNTSNTLTIGPWGADAGGPHFWAAGDTYEIRLVLIALDQPGRGQCDLLTNATTTLSGGITFPVSTITVASTAAFPSSATTLQVGGVGPVSYTGKTSNTFTGVTGGYGTIASGATVNMALNSTTGTAAWPNQLLEPCYSWNNLYNGVDGTNRHFNFNPNVGSGGNNGEHPQLISGRDYKNDTAMPGYVPYQYPHPLVTGSVPTANKNIQLTGNMAFGNVIIGGLSATSVLNVSNNGDTLLTVTAVSYPTGFTGATGGFTVAPGASFAITVTFTPLLPQLYSGTITATSDATTGNGTIACSGTGIIPTPPIHGHKKQARDPFQF